MTSGSAAAETERESGSRTEHTKLVELFRGTGGAEDDNLSTMDALAVAQQMLQFTNRTFTVFWACAQAEVEVELNGDEDQDLVSSRHIAKVVTWLEGDPVFRTEINRQLRILQDQGLLEREHQDGMCDNRLSEQGEEVVASIGCEAFVAALAEQRLGDTGAVREWCQ